MTKNQQDPNTLTLIERYLSDFRRLGLDWHQSGENQWYGQCPGHHDRHKSAALTIGADGWPKFDCKVGCDWRVFPKAVGVDLHRNGNRKLSRELAKREQQAMRLHRNALQDDERLREWRQGERWTIEAIDALLIGRWEEYASFPERDGHGRIIGQVRYLPHQRRRAGKPRHRAEGKRGLSYRAGGPQGSRLLFVEGASCAAAALSLGYEPVGYPSASFTLPRAWRRVAKERECIVLPDPDAEQAGWRLAETILPVAASVAVVPTGQMNFLPRRGSVVLHGDIADALREHGPERATEIIEHVLRRAEPLKKPSRGRPPTSREQAEAYLREVLSDHAWRELEANRGKPPRGSLLGDLQGSEETTSNRTEKDREKEVANPSSGPVL